jgi:hypothetical protein
VLLSFTPGIAMLSLLLPLKEDTAIAIGIITLAR